MCIPDREFVFLDYIDLHLLVTLLGTLSFYWFGHSFSKVLETFLRDLLADRLVLQHPMMVTVEVQ